MPTTNARRALLRRVIVALGVSACGARSTLDLALDGDGGANAGRADAGVEVGEDTGAPCGADCATDAFPRAIAPLSTATVTSHRPVLRWELAAGQDGAQVEICQDRGCTSVVPASDLAKGLYYWRLHGTRNGVVGASTSPVWEFEVGARNAAVNTSWGTTLDVNGDGFADVAVGAPALSADTGEVDVYLGGPSGLSGTPAVLRAPDGTGASFGGAVASAGDVNGDGFADLAVGAYGATTDGGALDAGVVYVYLGGPNGLSTIPLVLAGPGGPYGFFGLPVASAGDVNGDGFADLVVGASGAGGNATGAVYVYFGGAGGLSTTPFSIAAPFGPDGAFGTYVACADVNGDGLGDIVVAAPVIPTGPLVYVYYGDRNGLSTAPTTTLAHPAGLGPDVFGDSLASADVNGDGFADIIVGALGPGTTPASAYVFLGGQGEISTNGAGLDAPVALAGTVAFPVAGAGDVDGDGFDDVLVGSESGSAYLYRGSGAGLSTPPVVLADLGSPDGAFGYSVAGAGDVNRDGFADIVIGLNNINTFGGRGYVSFGGASGLSSPLTAIVVPTSIEHGHFGYSVASAARKHAGQARRAESIRSNLSRPIASVE